MVLTFFRLKNLKSTAKARVNLMGPNSLRGTKIVFVIPQSQGITNTPRSFCMGVLPGWGSSNYVLIPSFKMLKDVLCFENNKLLTKEELLMTPNNINLIVSFFLD